tara:strand:+ start:3497 stop:4663 length:1167 start_codon:yes stop_codon:yes gene_type:complete
MSKQTDYLEQIWANNKPLWYKSRNSAGDSLLGGYMDLMMLGRINPMMKGTMFDTALNGYKGQTQLGEYENTILRQNKQKLLRSGVPSMFENPALSTPMINLYEATVKRRFDESGGHFSEIASDINNKMFGNWFVLSELGPTSVIFPQNELNKLGLDRDDVIRGQYRAYIHPLKQGRNLEFGWYQSNTDAENEFNRIYKGHNRDMLKTIKDLSSGNLGIVPIQSPGTDNYVKDGWVFAIRYGDPDMPSSWHIVGEVKVDGETLQHTNSELLEHFASSYIVNFLQDYKDDWFGTGYTGFTGGWDLSREEIIKQADDPSPTAGYIITDHIPRSILAGWTTFSDPRELEHRYVIKPLAEKLKKNPKLTVEQAVESMLEDYYPTPDIYSRIRK